uniref:Transmembrane protein 65 n=1 Tax=Setaria digitata TaxID=48799 RepID=A0A915PMU7_9BILA
MFVSFSFVFSKGFLSLGNSSASSVLGRCCIQSSTCFRRYTPGVLRQNEEVRIQDACKAQALVTSLSTDERKLLQTALVNSIPFIGFGFLDNAIMVVAGEYIDKTIGTWLALSTMAAAALGNTVSDVAGIGLAHYVELIVSKCGIKHPVLNSQQLESSFVRAVTNLGRGVGLIAGCLIGMFPLLFFDPSSSKMEVQDIKEKNDSP